MQIDFHHATTYVLARLAGFDPSQAEIVAYSAQYVDDAVNSGPIEFANGAMYARISSAHKMLDYRNFVTLADHLVWVPFHFLPGNGGLPRGQDPQGSFIRKLVCTPNSHVAQDMIRSVIETCDRRHALHRLGIAMHTYADTWAHQGFAGVRHEINHAIDLTDHEGHPHLSLVERLKNYFIELILPLGHGTVLGNPDRPYLVWGYTNGLGERIERNNPRDFLDACEQMTKAMQRFIAADPDYPAPGLRPEDRDTLRLMITEIRLEEADERHEVWLEEIANGAFSFGPEQIEYVGEGEGSWKHHALGVLDPPDDGFVYAPEFLKSDWKLFHDALQAHRLDLVSNILPEYGICVA